MPAAVDYVPQSLSFGGVLPGSSGPDITPVSDLPSFAGGIQIKSAPADATATFNISGDTDHFSIRDVFLMELVDEPVGSGDLGAPGSGGHPGHPTVKVLEVVGESDGSGPIQVKKGQHVLVRVKYSAGNVEGTFTGTLTIQGDTWDPVAVKLSLFPAQVISRASDTLTIAQGHQAGLAVLVNSAMGPEVEVSFEMSNTQLHTGLTMLANQCRLEPRQTASVPLVFEAAADAPLGAQQVAIDQIAFRRRGFFITANIVRPQIVVNSARPTNIRALKRNVGIPLPINVSLSGGPQTSIDFWAALLPAGVSMQTRSFPVQTDSVVELELFPGDQAPDQFSFFIEWSAFGGDQHGTIDYTVTIKTETVVRDSGTLGPSTVTGSAHLWLNSDGFWTYQGHIHESGFVGHNYAFAIVLDFLDPSGKAPSFVQIGSIHGTDPIDAGSSDDDWQQSGHDSLIADNWDVIKTRGIRSDLHVSTEPLSALEAAVGAVVLALVAAVGAVAEGRYLSDSRTHCAPKYVVSDDEDPGAEMHCTQESP